MEKIVKKDFKIIDRKQRSEVYNGSKVRYITIFESGKFYKTWENFGGINFFAENKELKMIHPFSPGDVDGDDRIKFYDYFYTIEEMRDIKIQEIL